MRVEVAPLFVYRIPYERRICMKKTLKCNNCGFEKEIELTPHGELKSKDIEIKGGLRCDKCRSENVEII